MWVAPPRTPRNCSTTFTGRPPFFLSRIAFPISASSLHIIVCNFAGRCLAIFLFALNWFIYAIVAFHLCVSFKASNCSLLRTFDLLGTATYLWDANAILFLLSLFGWVLDQLAFNVSTFGLLGTATFLWAANPIIFVSVLVWLGL